MCKAGIYAALLFLSPLFSGISLAQDTTQVKPVVKVSGFADVYYAYDFNKPVLGSSRNIPYAYNHSRHNEFAVNLALVQASVSATDYRAAIGLQAGTYPLMNYAAEPDHFRHLHNANAGVRLKGNIWLDAGIWGSSHIGFESAASTGNWTLTRSLSAENSPYYETGARLAYEGDKLSAAILVLNGWQNIVDRNSNKALGTQITYTPSQNLRLNYSTFFGNEQPDFAPAQYRFFQNFYVVWQVTEKLGVTFGSDLGLEETVQGNTDHKNLSTWYAETLIVRYQLAKKWAAAARAEYYSDARNVIVDTGQPNTPFQVAGFSVNADYSPRQEVMLRAEARLLDASRGLFFRQPYYSAYRPTLTASMAVGF